MSKKQENPFIKCLDCSHAFLMKNKAAARNPIIVKCVFLPFGDRDVAGTPRHCSAFVLNRGVRTVHDMIFVPKPEVK
mgnify:FL=1